MRAGGEDWSLELRILLRRRFLPAIVAGEYREFIGTATKPISGTLRRVEIDGSQRRGTQAWCGELNSIGDLERQ